MFSQYGLGIIYGFHLTLPDHDDIPAHLALRMPMPKAAVYKDNTFPTLKHQIGTPWEPIVVQPEPQTYPVGALQRSRGRQRPVRNELGLQ